MPADLWQLFLFPRGHYGEEEEKEEGGGEEGLGLEYSSSWMKKLNLYRINLAGLMQIKSWALPSILLVFTGDFTQKRAKCPCEKIKVQALANKILGANKYKISFAGE